MISLICIALFFAVGAYLLGREFEMGLDEKYVDESKANKVGLFFAVCVFLIIILANISSR